MTQLELINDALILIGANPLQSIADTSKSQRVSTKMFPVVRDTSLRAHPWNFATRRIALTTPDGTAPVYGFTYRFPLPSVPKCLRVLEVEGEIPFSVEENFICCDSASIKIKYVVRIEDTTLWDDTFNQYFIHKLAAKIALNLMQNVDMHDRFDGAAEKLITDAKFLNATESSGEKESVLDVSSWLNSRIV